MSTSHNLSPRESGRTRDLERLLRKETWGGRDAHGGIPFDQKRAWQQGYAEARRQIFDALPGAMAALENADHKEES